MRLIDADRLTREEVLHLWYHLPNGDMACPKVDIDNAPTINAIVIPENATNGDVIFAIILATFHNVTLFADTHGYGYVYSGDVRCAENYLMTYNKEWWNAPYKESEG